ncbi:MAG TPA: response regulator transcription factor [Streptosporangiaceae bacterium]|nr:response regulator transcription factor [Streptosporangiaceae bacterium]
MTGDDGAGTVRVLIADDDARVRTALRSYLCASSGFDVIADVGSAPAALELAREHAPAVAVIGVQLPSAREGLSLLRAITGELAIPAVAISLHGGLRSRALAAGACQFVEKDSSPEVLLAALRTAARQDSSEGQPA